MWSSSSVLCSPQVSMLVFCSLINHYVCLVLLPYVCLRFPRSCSQSPDFNVMCPNTVKYVQVLVTRVCAVQCRSRVQPVRSQSGKSWLHAGRRNINNSYVIMVVWLLANRQTHRRHMPGAGQVTGHRVLTTHAFRCWSMFVTLHARATFDVAAFCQRQHAHMLRFVRRPNASSPDSFGSAAQHCHVLLIRGAHHGAAAWMRAAWTKHMQ